VDNLTGVLTFISFIYLLHVLHHSNSNLLRAKFVR
jgi:hypothetical protein